MRTPIKLRRLDRENFATLQRAAAHGRLTLVSAIRKADGAPVAIVCALADNAADDDLLAFPLAVMITSDHPIDLFENPFEDVC